MTTGTKKWTQVLSAAATRGHAYWKDESGRIAVSDNSIRRAGDPSTTDDGLLYVDADRLSGVGLVLEPSRSHGGLSAMVPLVDEQGRSSATGAATREAVALAAVIEVAVSVRVDGHEFVPAGPARAQSEQALEAMNALVGAKVCIEAGDTAKALKYVRLGLYGEPKVEPCKRCGEPTGDADQTLCDLCRGHKGEPYPEPDDLGGAL
jgi:hypothetical protein